MIDVQAKPAVESFRMRRAYCGRPLPASFDWVLLGAPRHALGGVVCRVARQVYPKANLHNRGSAETGQHGGFTIDVLVLCHRHCDENWLTLPRNAFNSDQRESVARGLYRFFAYSQRPLSSEAGVVSNNGESNDGESVHGEG